MKLRMIAFLTASLAVGQAQALSVTTTDDDAVLVGEIVGAGITVISSSYTGGVSQSGTFSDGDASGIGFDEGIVLTTGRATDADGPNGNTGTETLGVGDTSNDDASVATGTAGDADLSAIVGTSTFNAAALEFVFEFTGGGGGNLVFQFVFASEEYIDFVGSGFNDVFALYVDGVNRAIVPGTLSTPVAINNVNPTTNSAYYRNNVANTNGYPVAGVDTRYDGLTTVFTALALNLGAGQHTVKFVIADTLDQILDSGVFIKAGSFTQCGVAGGPECPEVPEPGSLALLGLGLAGLGLARRRKSG